MDKRLKYQQLIDVCFEYLNQDLTAKQYKKLVAELEVLWNRFLKA